MLGAQEVRLFTDAAVAFVATIAFASVARRVWGKGSGMEISSEEACSLAWWVGLAGTGFIAGLMSALAAFDVLTVAVLTVLTRLVVLVFSVALVGLVAGLFHAFSGKPRSVYPILLAYALFNVIQNVEYTRNPPVGVEIQAWRPMLVLAEPPHVAFQVVSFALLLVPPLLGAVGQFVAFARSRAPAARFRLATTGAAILAWVPCVAVIALPQGFPGDLWQLVGRLVFLLSAAALVLAHDPPGWIAARWPNAGGNVQMGRPASTGR